LPPAKDEELPASTATESAPESAPESAMADAVVRFSWRTDAQGRIAEISESFGALFGPKASAITGMNFDELARRFGVDRDGEIAALLSRRDPWSARTLYWPVEGTDRMVPVDLAALPTFDRDRS